MTGDHQSDGSWLSVRERERERQGKTRERQRLEELKLCDIDFLNDFGGEEV